MVHILQSSIEECKKSHDNQVIVVKSLLKPKLYGNSALLYNDSCSFQQLGKGNPWLHYGYPEINYVTE
jgi:hypothetical protein